MDRNDNFQQFIENVVQKKSRMDSSPVQFMFGLTNVCNLHCAFCHYCGFCMSKIEKPVSIPLELLKQLKPYLHCAKFVNPSGRGEPFLYHDFDAFIEICRESDALCSMQLTNNGTQLDRYELSKLGGGVDGKKGVNIIAVSIDSVDPKTFEILRLGAKLSHVLENVKKLRAALPDTVLQWCVVVNRLNMTQLKDLCQAAVTYGIDYITFNDVYGYEEDQVIQLLRLRESDKEIVEQQFQEILKWNADQKIVVNNVISWSGFEDGKLFDQKAIFAQLEQLKQIQPYLDFDKFHCEETASRRVKTEKKKIRDHEEICLPYCTNPFEVMFIQPDQTVSPCCASFGIIDKIKDNGIEAVWNGKNYQNLREAMFHWEMLPDYCLQCESFMRYDYIDDIWAYLKKAGAKNIRIPPNYQPPAGIIKDKELLEMIKAANEKQEQKIQKQESQESVEFARNSQEYWNFRFESNWEMYGGKEQTRYFADLLIEMLPEWLIYEINENRDAVCDLGCAQGDALTIYKQAFRTSEIAGEDFSESAIAKAQKNYPEFLFQVGDIFKPDKEKKYPVVIASNVVEHFKQPYDVIEHICRRAEKYALILMPYREEQGVIEEHESVFYTKDIPLRVGDSYLVYAKSAECGSVYYPYEQILLIYAKQKIYSRLSDLVENIDSDCMRAQRQVTEQEQNNWKQQEREKEYQIETFKELADNSKRELDKQNSQLQVQEKQLHNQSECLKAQEKQLHDQMEQIQAQKKQLAEENSRKSEQQKQILALEEMISAMEIKNKQAEARIRQIQSLCISYASAKLSRFNHLLIRLHVQYMRGSKAERKAFLKWLKGKASGTNHDTADVCRFNPWMDVHQRLSEALACTSEKAKQAHHGQKTTGREHPLSDRTKAMLKQPYTKYDVIILSVIDYDFRHQRPQHFAEKFAEHGHRVFYINANFTSPAAIRKKRENLYLVNWNSQKTSNIYTADWRKNEGWLHKALNALLERYAIRDAVTIVDYPNWLAGANYLRETYGFRIVTDYMDDYTGFAATAEPFLKKNCKELLTTSDLVVASSSFLYDIAKRFTDESRICLIRNGTQTAHFQKAYAMRRAQDTDTDVSGKVIGYYGAVAHWFAYEKVCYVADALPECEVVIIGEVTAHRRDLEKRKNIRLLGEMDYDKLPEHLAYFDVCLIPFDTGTDLIRATNPVKFYEYLSAGKKIVATEIPELRPYRDRYVYLSNDNDEFLNYVKLCLERKDTLNSARECMEFAGQNDWQERFGHFAAACQAMVPKVSVVVLAYNNEAVNRKCIESILTQTAYPHFELIVVDNASTDGTRAYLQELDAQNRHNVKIILNNENLGFAGGNNCGIKAADGVYVVLLNNDTYVTRGWMTSLVKHLENDRSYAMCNPVTNSIGNESKIEAHYHGAAELAQFAYCYTQTHMGEEYHRVDRLPLFATMIRRSVLEEVGLLDEAYKVGMFEDDDFTEKVLRAGYRIVIAEDAFVHHMQRASFAKLEDAEYQRIFEENRKIFEKKWKKVWRMPRYRDGVDAGTSQGCEV